MADVNAEIGNNIAKNDNFLQLRPILVISIEFFLILSDNIQLFIGSQQLDFIRYELGISISKLIVKVKESLLFL